MARRDVSKQYTKGAEHSEGKTKKNFISNENPLVLIMEAKDDITAKDDKTLTRILEGKSGWANETSSAVFDLYADAGLPVAYIGRTSEGSFAAHKAIMLGFEVLARRETPNGSSYLKRNPHLTREDGEPHYISKLLVEFCLKTTGGGYKIPNGQIIVEGLDAADGQEDPIIRDPRAKSWVLTHSKKPKWDANHVLRNLSEEQVQLVIQDACFKLQCTQEELIKKVEFLTRWGFLLLEGAFKKLNAKLQDIKFEFGIWYVNGKWVLGFADVIDCDSWRLSINGKQFSKQTFRDKGEDGLEECAANYAYITNLVQQFGIPKQVLVIWSGSSSDPEPDLSKLKEDLPTLDIIYVTLSGHKETIKCIKKIHEIMSHYPQGGVFAVDVGRSNGAGPVISAHSYWPVMSCPVTYKDFSEDIHSSVRMPSETPNLTVWPMDNIVPSVLNFLSASNPAAYALRRMRIEELDDPI